MARSARSLSIGFLALTLAPSAHAQLNDLVVSPNTAGAGIHKSLAQQVGAGRGNTSTPGSSTFIIARDPFRSVRRGRQIFQRKFRVAEGFGPRKGPDGAGSLDADRERGAGLVDSCAGCHGRPKGSAGHGGNVFTRPDSRDAPHLFGLGLVEMLGDEITSDLRALRAAAVAQARLKNHQVTVELASKGIGYGKLTAFADGTVDGSQIRGVDQDLRVKPFFANGAAFSIRQFDVGAFQAEMGLQSADPDLAAACSGQIVTTPAGMVLDGTLDTLACPPADSPGADPDGDHVTNEVDTAVSDHLEFYLLNYFKPALYEQSREAQNGRRVFDRIGCNQCHIADLPIDHDRRVADVETVYDPKLGIFNDLFATATKLIVEVNDGTGLPTLKSPAGKPFLVRNLYADFRRHDLGPAFHEIQFDGTVVTQFMTEPLWGVATTAPYGHDGRSLNLKAVILRHGGEAAAQSKAFRNLSDEDQRALLEFLGTLVLFPPDDTASNLDPGNPQAAGFPQLGHGSIKLGALFNDPTDPE
jgi:hypothetical protein